MASIKGTQNSAYPKMVPDEVSHDQRKSKEGEESLEREYKRSSLGKKSHSSRS